MALAGCYRRWGISPRPENGCKLDECFKTVKRESPHRKANILAVIEVHISLDLPCFRGELLAHFPALGLELHGTFEGERWGASNEARSSGAGWLPGPLD